MTYAHNTLRIGKINTPSIDPRSIAWLMTDKKDMKVTRLREARKNAGYDSAAAAARAFGWPEAAHRHHENGTRELQEEPARRYARRYKVKVSWLLCLDDAIGSALDDEEEPGEAIEVSLHLPNASRLKEMFLGLLQSTGPVPDQNELSQELATHFPRALQGALSQARVTNQRSADVHPKLPSTDTRRIDIDDTCCIVHPNSPRAERMDGWHNVSTSRPPQSLAHPYSPKMRKMRYPSLSLLSRSRCIAGATLR